MGLKSVKTACMSVFWVEDQYSQSLQTSRQYSSIDILWPFHILPERPFVCMQDSMKIDLKAAVGESGLV
jgi:hypothetical protein